MDPLGALKQLSATELRFLIALYEDAARACRAEIALYEDAVRACRAEPVSRTARLDALPDEIQLLIFGQLCNALDPRTAVDFISASKGLWELTQAPRQQLQADYEVAAALGWKAGKRSCKELREAKIFHCFREDLSSDDLAFLGTLGSVLPALEDLQLSSRAYQPAAGPDSVPRLAEKLGAGALPAVTTLAVNMHVGDAGASALAAALGRGALPRLKILWLYNAAIGDAGLVALAPALRRLPALEELYLRANPFGDEGISALVAPPPPAGAPPPTTGLLVTELMGLDLVAKPPRTGVLAKLETLDLWSTQITDAGCAALASALDSGALPALRDLLLIGIPASAVAKATVRRAGARAGFCVRG